ncbi:unnamed protein product [Vicia faba]|uniref:Reverse transcriptase domain-containing protein n=1 Tax=Vicia faba TaxID=3906 RepID=A0AAV0ZSJ4_VICFA|nr:unnamed protein product [Vicia faba]
MFKIISKILADRLAPLMPHLISSEQRGFIQGRHIKDSMGLASEAINLLDSKSWCGKIVLKVDIAKAFDTLKWSFLLKVLNQFGFNNSLCSWIQCNLQSVVPSIFVNDSLNGYFNCTNRVRRGDPLSPLLFCQAEDVLSRHLYNLVISG